MKLDHVVYKCSGCHFIRMFPSAVHAHCRSSLGCRDQTPVKYEFKLDFPDQEKSCTTCPNIPRTPPGPKPLDINSILHGRLAAFDDDDDTTYMRRVDYLFSTEGLIDKCFQSTTNDKVPGYIVKLFFSLWGNHAPKEFQSIIMYRGKVYEVTFAYDDGTINYEEFISIHNYFTSSNFLGNFRECIQDICTVYIPRYRPDIVSRANHIIEWIQKSDDGSENSLTMQDVFDRNDKYHALRKKCDKMVGKANRISSTLANAIKSTKIKKQNTT